MLCVPNSKERKIYVIPDLRNLSLLPTVKVIVLASPNGIHRHSYLSELLGII